MSTRRKSSPRSKRSSPGRKRPRKRTAPAALKDVESTLRSEATYALPYYTRAGGDTEVLLSNPGPSPLHGGLLVFGGDCRLVEEADFELGPNCTRTFRIRPVAPDAAGFVVVKASAPVIAHLLHYRPGRAPVAGGELGGAGNLWVWDSDEASRTYGFGYRAAPIDTGPVTGAVYVSNPHSATLDGEVVFYDQRCGEAGREGLLLQPGCTAEIPFPNGRFGYGRVRVSGPAVIHVVHFGTRAGGLAASELVGEDHRIPVPVETPPGGTKILFDGSHGSMLSLDPPSVPPGLIPSQRLEDALVAAGYEVDRFEGPEITAAVLEPYDVVMVATAQVPYSEAEKQAMVDFVNTGGGLFVAMDFGGFATVTRLVLHAFGADSDTVLVEDPLHSVPGSPSSSWLILEQARNFVPHVILQGISSAQFRASTSMWGGAGWQTVIESDDDAMPPRRPLLMARSFGSGRVVVCGDFSWLSYFSLDMVDNEALAVRCVEWLLFQI